MYQHWKGPLYLVIGYCGDANDDERDLVVYVGLELTPSARPGPRIRVRDLADFFARLDPTTGRALADDDTGPFVYRFTYIGPEWFGQRTPVARNT